MTRLGHAQAPPRKHRRPHYTDALRAYGGTCARRRQPAITLSISTFAGPFRKALCFVTAVLPATRAQPYAPCPSATVFQPRLARRYSSCDAATAPACPAIPAIEAPAYVRKPWRPLRKTQLWSPRFSTACQTNPQTSSRDADSTRSCVEDQTWPERRGGGRVQGVPGGGGCVRSAQCPVARECATQLQAGGGGRPSARRCRRRRRRARDQLPEQDGGGEGWHRRRRRRQRRARSLAVAGGGGSATLTVNHRMRRGASALKAAAVLRDKRAFTQQGSKGARHAQESQLDVAQLIAR